MAAPRHFYHHHRLIYSTTLRRHLTSVAVVLVLLILVLIFIFNSIYPQKPLSLSQLSFLDLILATISSLERLLIAYCFALFFSIPLALLITVTPRVEKVLLPFFDVLESVPVLVFFPVIVLVFFRIGSFEGAAVFILFMAMIWNLVFSMVGGLSTIPQDIKEASVIFRAKGLKKLWYITLPSIFPFIVTGSLLAFAQGWNILIIAEVIHNYIPGGTAAEDRFGLGSLLVNSSLQGNTSLFIASIAVLILIITLINFFVWQKLLKLSERYKFE